MGFGKYLLAGAVAGATLLWTPRYERPVEFTKGPIINTANEVRYVFRADEREGVCKIRELLSSQYEEQWVFLPSQQLWVEIGCRETLDRKLDPESPVLARVSTEFDIVARLARKDQNLVHYHFHADTNDLTRSRINDYFTAFPGEFTAEEIQILQETVRVERQLPSAEDILWLMVARRDAPYLRAKIVGPFGVTENVLTQRGEAFAPMEYLRLAYAAVLQAKEFYGAVGRVYAYREAMKTQPLKPRRLLFEHSDFTIFFTPYDRLLPEKK